MGGHDETSGKSSGFFCSFEAHSGATQRKRAEKYADFPLSQ